MTVPLLVPDWPAPARVHAACSGRAGGVSAAPYDSLNLGDHVGDDINAVMRNRERYTEALQGGFPVFMRQVHGTATVEIDETTEDGIEADACITTTSAVACTIMVADCLPILFTDSEGQVVGAAHAGWRGLAGENGRGIVESLWESFWPLVAADRAEAASRTLAWLGPCIGPRAFEVGGEVKEAFEVLDSSAGRFFAPSEDGKWLADLPALARARLHSLGIAAVYGNDGDDAWCTVTNPSRFFSHRRDRTSGRFAASIWLS